MIEQIPLAYVYARVVCALHGSGFFGFNSIHLRAFLVLGPRGPGNSTNFRHTSVTGK